jgi:MFS family permease
MALSGIFSAIMSFFTHKIEKKFGLKNLLIFIPIVYSLLSFGLISTIPYIFNILLGGLNGILYIVYIDYVNKRIPSEKRATILSMCSMVYSLYMIIFFPIFGRVADVYSFNISFISVSIILFILSIINGIILIKK